MKSKALVSLLLNVITVAYIYSLHRSGIIGLNPVFSYLVLTPLMTIIILNGIIISKIRSMTFVLLLSVLLVGSLAGSYKISKPDGPEFVPNSMAAKYFGS